MTKVPCDRCGRPARVRRLYYRPPGGPAAIYAGAFGRACFYIAAHAIADVGGYPEREDARLILLRGRS